MQMMESKIPGVSIAVIKDYRVEWAAGFGMSDTAHQVKVTPDTLFQAASVSKAISAIALMIALEEHKLSVDDEVMPPSPSSLRRRASDNGDCATAFQPRSLFECCCRT